MRQRYELRERNSDLRLQVYELEKRSQLLGQSLQVRPVGLLLTMIVVIINFNTWFFSLSLYCYLIINQYLEIETKVRCLNAWSFFSVFTVLKLSLFSFAKLYVGAIKFFDKIIIFMYFIGCEFD